MNMFGEWTGERAAQTGEGSSAGFDMVLESPVSVPARGKPGAADTQIVRALLLGGRLDVRGFEVEGAIATTPLTVRVEGGTALLFRYGVVVLADVPEDAERRFLESLRGRISDPCDPIETEQAVLRLRADADEQIDPSGTIHLREASPERLQVVASALSKSVVLGHYEARIAVAFDRLEPLAERLGRKGRVGSKVRDLLRQIGYVLQTQQLMVGRVEIGEKPEVLWDHPALERLYVRLEDEYELRERSQAIERKLELIHDSVGTLLELVQDKRSLRLEWYVIILILVEIILSAYEFAWQHLF
jgi:required for meiotic nuclear division protein 1